MYIFRSFFNITTYNNTSNWFHREELSLYGTSLSLILNFSCKTLVIDLAFAAVQNT